MLQIDELLDWLGTVHLLDTGFNLAILAESLDSDIPGKASFSTTFGLHQFVTLLFGLFGAPLAFQYFVDRILHPHNAYVAA